MVDSGMQADCFLPHDILLCIFTRLPVKSLVRFKSVCKSLCELFSTPEFIKMHLDQFSSDPKNHSFIIHHSGDYRARFSLLSSIESSGEKKSTKLRQPCPTPFSLPKYYFLGCCNGLVCMADNPLHDFVLWNPALKIFKHISLPRSAFKGHDHWWSWWMPFGFCYDAEEADFKVVVIYVRNKKIGIYSNNSDSWKTIEIELDFVFTIFGYKHEVIVNGNPYWKAKVDGNQVLVWFDVRKLDLKIVPLSSTFNFHEYTSRRQVLFVDCEGRLSALVYFKLEGRIESWVLFSDGEEVIWRKNHEFRSIDHMKFSHVFACWSGRKIVVWEYKNTRKLFVEDPENGCVDEIVFDETPEMYYGIYHYTESLAYVQGMIKYQE